MINSAPWWSWLIIGLIVGFIFSAFTFDKKKHDGVIHITPGTEEKPDNYLFEFNVLN